MKNQRICMYYFFKDLYQIAPYLIDTFDNLFSNIIVLSLYQTFQKKDETIKQQSCLILSNLSNAEVIISKRLLICILILLFSREIPKIQTIQLELNYIPTKDPEIVKYCARFFKNSQKDVEKEKGLFQSISQTISFVSQNSIFFKEYQNKSNVKLQQLLDTLKNQILTCYLKKTYQQMMNILIISKIYVIYFYSLLKSTVTQYKLYQKQHYQQIKLCCQYVRPKNKYLQSIYQLLCLRNNKMCQTLLENCQEIIVIINQLIENQDQNFIVTQVRLNLLRQMEQNIQSQTIEKYRYFSIIFQSIQDKNIDVFQQIPVTHQMIRYLLHQGLTFQRNWLKNPFSKTFNPLSNEEQQYNNGLIKLNNLNLIIENKTYNLDEWKIAFQSEQKNSITFVNIINDERQKLVFLEVKEAKLIRVLKACHLLINTIIIINLLLK